MCVSQGVGVTIHIGLQVHYWSAAVHESLATLSTVQGVMSFPSTTYVLVYYWRNSIYELSFDASCPLVGLVVQVCMLGGVKSTTLWSQFCIFDGPTVFIIGNPVMKTGLPCLFPVPACMELQLITWKSSRVFKLKELRLLDMQYQMINLKHPNVCNAVYWGQWLRRLAVKLLVCTFY